MAERCIVYHSARVTPNDFETKPSAGAPSSRHWRSADELFSKPITDAEPVVLIADTGLLELMDELRAIPEHVVILALDAASVTALGKRVDVDIAGIPDAGARHCLLGAACQLASSRLGVRRMQQQIDRTDDEFRELNRVGIALMHEHDRAALLTLILAQGKQLTESDGAGVLFLETDEFGVPTLRPVVYDFDSLPGLGLPTITYGIDNTSVVGHAALIKKPVVVADAQALPTDSDFVTSAEFRRRYQYVARSMLAVPMLNHQNALLGVIFFINRKADPQATVRTAEQVAQFVLPYGDREVRLARSLGSQAAVSIENARLYNQIEHIFESFVKAAVSAIDARDPTTAGHSLRVAALATGLAEAVERAGRGPYRDFRFTRKQMRELRFAALLHDLGKVTVHEDVLVKAKKLSPVLWERVNSRFSLIHRTIELEYCQRRAERAGVAAATPSASALDAELAERLRELDRMRDAVRKANVPTVLDAPASSELIDIATRTFLGVDGGAAPYLTPEELCYLRLPKGTLDDRERAEIESHVDNTHRFLVQIPWTDDLKNLATYAYGHHEKLNGTGYPQRLKGDEIPVQTRLITLADIFDALTEGDRPYKAAVSADQALDIIRTEADAGLLDRDLVDIMTESQVYRKILEEDWHRL